MCVCVHASAQECECVSAPLLIYSSAQFRQFIQADSVAAVHIIMRRLLLLLFLLLLLLPLLLCLRSTVDDARLLWAVCYRSTQKTANHNCYSYLQFPCAMASAWRSHTINGPFLLLALSTAPPLHRTQFRHNRCNLTRIRLDCIAHSRHSRCHTGNPNDRGCDSIVHV